MRVRSLRNAKAHASGIFYVGSHLNRYTFSIAIIKHLSEVSARI